MHNIMHVRRRCDESGTRKKLNKQNTKHVGFWCMKKCINKKSDPNAIKKSYICIMVYLI